MYSCLVHCSFNVVKCVGPTRKPDRVERQLPRHCLHHEDNSNNITEIRCTVEEPPPNYDVFHQLQRGRWKYVFPKVEALLALGKRFLSDVQ